MLPKFILYFEPDSAPGIYRTLKTFNDYMDCFMYRRKIMRQKKLDEPGSLIIKVRFRNETTGKMEEW